MKSRGFDIDDEELWTKIAVGPRKPHINNPVSTSTLMMLKPDEPHRQYYLHITVTYLGNDMKKPYELVFYPSYEVIKKNK